MATTWQFINHLLAGKEAADLFIKLISWWKGKKLPSPNDPVPEGAEKGKKEPSLPEGTAQKVQSIGKADDLGLAVLRSLFWSTELVVKPGEESLNREQRLAIGYFLTELTELGPNKRVAFKRMLALGAGENVVRMTFKEEVEAAKDGKDAVTRPVTEALYLAPESVIILRGIANDILQAGEGESVQRLEAKALVKRLNDLDVFDNLPDDAAKLWEEFLDQMPVELRSGATLTKMREATARIGWSATYQILNHAEAQRIRARIRAASDDTEREAEHQKLRVYLVRCTKDLLRSSPNTKRARGITPKGMWTRGEWIIFIGTPAAIAALVVILAINS